MMTEAEFKKAIENRRDDYMRAGEKYINALLEGDFETALKCSLNAPDVLGTEVMAYIAKRTLELPNYEEVMDYYTEKCMEVSELMMDE